MPDMMLQGHALRFKSSESGVPNITTFVCKISLSPQGHQALHRHKPFIVTNVVFVLFCFLSFYNEELQRTLPQHLTKFGHILLVKINVYSAKNHFSLYPARELFCKLKRSKS